MLIITVGGTESYDEVVGQFVTVGGTVLRLEHSLVSLSKWESEFERPFLDEKEKSEDEIKAYVRAMNLSPEVSEEALSQLSVENLEEIYKYINAKMTATWFNDDPTVPKNQEIVTAEVIYYWMTALSIPFECQYWHLNRLLTLVRVCNTKQQPPKKMSRAEVAVRQRELNEQRRARFNTTG